MSAIIMNEMTKNATYSVTFKQRQSCVALYMLRELFIITEMRYEPTRMQKFVVLESKLCRFPHSGSINRLTKQPSLGYLTTQWMT